MWEHCICTKMYSFLKTILHTNKRVAKAPRQPTARNVWVYFAQFWLKIFLAILDPPQATSTFLDIFQHYPKLSGIYRHSDCLKLAENDLKINISYWKGHF